MKAIIKACCLGMVVLLGVNGIWCALLYLHFMPLMMLDALWMAPLAAALLTSYKSPRLKILLGALMAIPATSFGTVITAFYGDSSDFPGISGLQTFAAISLIANIVLCSIGSCIGYYMSRSRAGSPDPSGASSSKN
jgi:hypothetical protein